MNKKFCLLEDIDFFNVNILLRFMQLFSVHAPLGNFSYSHGLELAVSRNWVCSVAEFIVWQKELMNSQLVYLDLPILYRFYDCIMCNDIDRFWYYLEQLLSFRETYELRMEEQDRGKVIVQLMYKLGLSLDSCWELILKKSILAGIAWMGCVWKIPVNILCVGYSYSYIENNVISGLKLLLFGQFVAQQLIMYFLKLLPEILRQSVLITDNELGNSFPFQGISSSCHEVQDSRLFRS
ncbi:urease accessory protein UreF [Blochmannia endosymbiont of Polyrhachis (Hedomyrma) turneri]|uniref:urease accessory protein UreF n=1 Tax=Blochmannia endosymbiont of Polyrhachis (Hedomyrma) turneri TaxID=1505596 RepID=UPI00061A5F95|nr:urease accessory UreF family protein [Blochmannia endosymbiont of Polyrhachis (Hedomyrma) turneri]AKC60081.1 urease accessory protein ureF [Blochmannia endosymbiont of Polyrhachis (Hedomyrma) turneri]